MKVLIFVVTLTFKSFEKSTFLMVLTVLISETERKIP